MGETLEADSGPGRVHGTAASVRGVTEDRIDERPCWRPYRKGVAGLRNRQSLEKQVGCVTDVY